MEEALFHRRAAQFDWRSRLRETNYTARFSTLQAILTGTGLILFLF
jgi:hypothetical protein